MLDTSWMLNPKSPFIIFVSTKAGSSFFSCSQGKRAGGLSRTVAVRTRVKGRASQELLGRGPATVQGGAWWNLQCFGAGRRNPGAAGLAPVAAPAPPDHTASILGFQWPLLHGWSSTGIAQSPLALS